jgi:capsular polysaccharide biosynthesis protein
MAGGLDKEKKGPFRNPRPTRPRVGKIFWFGLPFLAAVTAGLSAAFFYTPQYQSSARIAWVEQGVGASPYPFTTGFSPLRVAPLEVLRSPETARRVWKRLHPQDTAFSEKDLAAFQKRIHIFPPPGYDPTGTEVLVVQVKDHDPEKAVKAANLLPLEGTLWAAEQEAEDLRRYSAFLDERIRRLEESIKKGDGKDLTGALPGQGRFENRAGPNDPRDTALYLEVLKTQAALHETRVVLSNLRRQVQEGAFPAKMVRENPWLGVLWERLSQLKNRLKDEELSKGVEPSKGGLKEETDRLQRVWEEQLAYDLEGRTIDLLGLEARLGYLQKALSRFEARSQKKWEGGALGDASSPVWAIYRRLLEEREGLRLVLAATPHPHPPFIFLEKALLPARPVGFGRWTLLGFGLALGTAVGGTALLLSLFWDRTLKSPEEAEKDLRVPVLGILSGE